jgi:hypothetical protein
MKREFDGKTRMFYNVIASGAKQSNGVNARLDCFVASLLAMTRVTLEHEVTG